MRLASNRSVSAVYDWDSLTILRQPALADGVAHLFTSDFRVPARVQLRRWTRRSPLSPTTGRARRPVRRRGVRGRLRGAHLCDGVHRALGVLRSAHEPGQRARPARARRRGDPAGQRPRVRRRPRRGVTRSRSSVRRPVTYLGGAVHAVVALEGRPCDEVLADGGAGAPVHRTRAAPSVLLRSTLARRSGVITDPIRDALPRDRHCDDVACSAVALVVQRERARAVVATLASRCFATALEPGLRSLLVELDGRGWLESRGIRPGSCCARWVASRRPSFAGGRRAREEVCQRRSGEAIAPAPRGLGARPPPGRAGIVSES
jgi:hypothetical protein